MAKRRAGPSRIAEFRQAKGWTQFDLAARVRALGIDVWPARISEYETGARIPEIPTARAIADALGVPFEDLEIGLEPATEVTP